MKTQKVEVKVCQPSRRYGGRPRVSVLFTEPSRTVQSQAADVDINEIIRRARASGYLSHVSERVGRYEDCTEIPDYQAALHIVNRADALFSDLPSEVRIRFNNDPANMVAFLQDESNREEAVKLGLIVVSDEAKASVAKTVDK